MNAEKTSGSCAPTNVMRQRNDAWQNVHIQTVPTIHTLAIDRRRELYAAAG